MMTPLSINIDNNSRLLKSDTKAPWWFSAEVHLLSRHFTHLRG